MSLGHTHEPAGDRAASGGAWQEALAILDELGDPRADTVRSRLPQVR